jgi:hypothetical protein
MKSNLYQMNKKSSYGRAKSPGRPTIILLGAFMFSAFGLWAQDLKKDSADNNGQIIKGTRLIGSYFNFSTSNTTKTKVKGVDTESSQIKLGGNITVGKMLSNHWGLLLNAGFVSSKTSTPQLINGSLHNLEDNRSDFTIAPSLRYYKFVSEGYYLFVQYTVFASAGTLVSDELDKSDNVLRYTYKTKGLGMGISPGFTYFMTNKLSTEISIGVLGYSALNGKDAFGNKTQVKAFQSLFYQNSVSLGFVLYISRK